MGDGAAWRRSALCSTEPCRVMTHHNKSLNFQGMTIKFLVNLLNIEKKKDGTRLISEVMNDTVLEHIVSGIDAVSGHRGRQYWQVNKY